MENQEGMQALIQRANELIDQVKTMPGKRPEFEKWIEKYHKGEGFSKGNISNLIKGNIGQMSVREVEAKVKKLEALVGEYEGVQKSASSARDKNPWVNKTPDPAVISALLGDMKWELYFFTTAIPQNKFAKLAKNVLYIDHTGTPVLTKYFLGEVKDYKGSIAAITDNIFEFDFYSKEDLNFSLHMKVYLNRRTEICLGVYSVTMQSYIYAGSVVLYKIESSENPQPHALSIYKHLQEMNKVPSAIKEFLYRREMSYIKIPESIISLSTLQDKIDDFKKKSDRETLFFEPSGVHIFISTPTFSLPDDGSEYFERYNRIQQMLKKTEDTFSFLVETGTLELDYPGSKRHTNNNPKRDYNDILESIKRSSIFVLILQEQVTSFCLVELGLALAFSKKIIVYGKKENLPKRLPSLPDLINYIKIEGEEDFDKITASLELHILDFLKSKLT